MRRNHRIDVHAERERLVLLKACCSVIYELNGHSNLVGVGCITSLQKQDKIQEKKETQVKELHGKTNVLTLTVCGEFEFEVNYILSIICQSVNMTRHDIDVDVITFSYGIKV